MGKVTQQTVEIKKSPRSTFGISSTKSGSARIGDLNMVFHKMLEPSDMIRCRVGSQILFISPLSVPAFAKMKVFTYYFFDSYQNVFPQFNDTIQNYMHESKESFKDGLLVTTSNYQMPSQSLTDLSRYICAGLDWDFPMGNTTTPAPPFGNLNSYDQGLLAQYSNYTNQYRMCYSTHEQKVDIVHLCNQFDIPYGALIPLAKNFTPDFSSNLPTSERQANTDVNFTYSSSMLSLIGQNPFVPYWFKYKKFAAIQNYISIANYSFSTLPFKVYQHIFNDWFLDTQKDLPNDFYPDKISYIFNQPTDAPFYRAASAVGVPALHGSTFDFSTFYLYLFNQKINHYMNSIFAIRRPWYSKDYFNTATNDPTLGVSPYSVGTSILDLRKNSALQRLAEKKALCGNKFVDFIAQHFNYYPPELDISRSIHLGTSVSTVDVSQVLQTSETTNASPQGERAATAQSYGRGNGVFFKAPTYGEFMVLQCIKPEIDYYEGLPREMRLVDAADFPLPELAQIGFDTISTSELWLNPAYNTDLAFGYTPRYSWRKTQLNRIYGELCNTLDYWHQSPSLRYGALLNYNFGQIGFDNLNQDSVANDYAPKASYNRIFAITDLNEDTYVYQHFIECTLSTCLPTNDSPQL